MTLNRFIRIPEGWITKTPESEEESMSENDSGNSGFWDQLKLPSLDSHFGSNWGRTALTTKAMLGGEPALVMQIPPRMIKESVSVKDFVGMLSSKLGLRTISIDQGAMDLDRDFVLEAVTPNSSWRFQFVSPKMVELYGNCNEQSLYDEVASFMTENTTKALPKGVVHVLVQTKDGIELQSMGVGGSSLERGNYEEEVLAGYDRIVKDLESEHPAGRVAILDGKPGTGKTYLVRGLLDQVKNAIFVIVPANLVSQLAQPSMIPALVGLHKDHGNKPMVFLIEDADEVIAKRMGDNMSAVSTVLNLGDGLLGQLLDVRILATTNADKADIDEAIKRPGRLSAMVHVGPLSPKKAAEVHRRLTNDEGQLFTKPVSLATVYQMARDSGWTPPKAEARIGFIPEDRGVKEIFDVEDPTEFI